MRVTLDIDTSGALADLRSHRNTIRRAAIWTANRTAEDVKTALQGEMQRGFSRTSKATTTKFVLNSLQTDYAKAGAAEIEAVVRTRDFGTRGVTARDILAPHVFGGSRPAKRSEIRVGWAAPGGQPVYMVPGKFAKLDANGNPDRGELVLILSQLGVLNEGDSAGQVRRRRRAQRRRTQYFAIWGHGEAWTDFGNMLKPGIYRRNQYGRALPVYVFMKGQPRYRKRLNWFETAAKTVREKAQPNFEAEVAGARRRAAGAAG